MPLLPSQMCENFTLLRRKYEALSTAHTELLWDRNVIDAAGLTKSIPEVDHSLEESPDRVSDIDLIKAIGRGTFSSVFLGKWPSGQKCAVKRISKSAAKSMLDLRNIATEYDALMTLSRGPCVLALHCAFASASNVYFVMEFFGQELYKYMRSHKDGLPQVLGTAVIHGVANGLAHMHALDFAHRDVKPENVLVEVGGNRFSDIIVKLCDLGLCAKLERVEAGNDVDEAPRVTTATSSPSSRHVSPRRRLLKDTHVSWTSGNASRLSWTSGSASPNPDRYSSETPQTPRSPFHIVDDITNRSHKPLFKCCGSMGFFAPDMLQSSGYSGTAADVWSLGCLGLEVVAGSTFFESFWFEKYTVFFKQRGRQATHEEFVDWMHPTVSQLRELVASYRDHNCNTTPNFEREDDNTLSFREASSSEKEGSEPREDSMRTKLRKNWHVLSIAATCLSLEPSDRPTAFEIREMISMYVGPDQRPLSSALSECASLVRQSSDQMPDSEEPATPKLTRVAFETVAHSGGGFLNLIKRNLRRSFSRQGIEATQRPPRSIDTAQLRCSEASTPRRSPTSPSMSLQSVLFRAHNGSNVRRVSPGDETKSKNGDLHWRSQDFGDHSPLAHDYMEGSEPSDLIARAKADYSGGLQRGKVLVVDDSSVALRWICRAIERQYNCEVHTASSALEALSLTQHTEYDAVLTDMIM